MTRGAEHGATSAGPRSGDHGTADPRRGEAFGEALEHLERLLRAYTIYTPDHEIARRFMADFGTKLLHALEGGGEVCLEVRANSVLLGETVIFREDPEGTLFVFGLHRDGVRRLVLLPSLTPPEIERIVAALSADLQDARNFDKDRVTLLREAELAGLRAVVAEVMGEDAGDSEQSDHYRGLMNAIIDAATEAHLPAGYESRLSEKVVRVASQALAEITSEQIAATLSMADDAGSVDAFTDDEYRRRCEELRQQYENPESMLRKFTEVLFRGHARGGEDNPAPLNTFDLLGQSLLKSCRYVDLLEIARLLLSLRAGPHAGASATADLMLGTLLKAERLAAVVSVLDSEAHRACASDLLQMLPADRWPEVLSSALRLTTREGREAVVALLAGWARADLRAVAGLLSSADEPESKLLIQALLCIGSERALAALAPLRHHRSPNIRFELLRVTRASGSPAIRAVRLGLLADENAKVRAEAEACLLLNRDPELLRWLERRLRSGELDEATLVEKRRVCELLGSRGGQREAELLRMLLERGSGTLAKRHLAETAAAAAHGLAVTGDRGHLALLEKEASRRLANRTLRNACREAVERLKAIVAQPDPARRVSPASGPDLPAAPVEPAAAPAPEAPAPEPVVASEPAAATRDVDELLKSFLEDGADHDAKADVDDLLRSYLTDPEREPR